VQKIPGARNPVGHKGKKKKKRSVQKNPAHCCGGNEKIFMDAPARGQPQRKREAAEKKERPVVTEKFIKKKTVGVKSEKQKLRKAPQAGGKKGQRINRHLTSREGPFRRKLKQGKGVIELSSNKLPRKKEGKREEHLPQRRKKETLSLRIPSDCRTQEKKEESFS